MEGQAQPGTRYISEDTFELSEVMLAYEAIVRWEFKSKEKPVNVSV